MLPLTIHFPIKNDERTLQATIDSVVPLNAELVALDLGSTDNSPRICRRNGVRTVSVKAGDMSAARNSVLSVTTNPWHLALDPWDVVVPGDLHKLVVGGPQAYHVQVVSGDALTKPIRLWHRATGCHFTNPVFESMSCPTAGHSGILIMSDPPPDDSKMAAVQSWQKSSPAAHEPWYFLACLHLEKREYDKFMSAANHYLFMDTRATLPAVMIKYYCGMVNCYIRKNAEAAIKDLLSCLAANPLMAEFWCMLGDVYYYLLKKYDKAKGFYENAKILGARRLKTDTWPLQISKYGEYPDRMLESCRAFVNDVRVLVQ